MAQHERAVGGPLDGGSWHRTALVLVLLLTVTVLGALVVHRHEPGAATAAAMTASGTTAPAATPSTSPPITVPGFATPSDYLACVRQSESRDEYTAVSPSGSYFGAYQFDQQTWNETVQHAGLTSLYDVQPNEVTPAAQDEVAMALLQWQGTSPWAGDC